CGDTTFTVEVGTAAVGGSPRDAVTIPGLGALPRTGATIGAGALAVALLLVVGGWLLIRRRSGSA
ncbi:MAG TPA: LPXTG cell wall anchor domain-containing protein, partial [Aeromicrobium sp.]|nr:LPXTG cell wall anchor domain-containing protein [Aeromicrobium sp.]